MLEFMAIRGRTYTVQGSDNLNDWAQVDFRYGEQEEATVKLPGYRCSKSTHYSAAWRGKRECEVLQAHGAIR